MQVGDLPRSRTAPAGWLDRTLLAALSAAVVIGLLIGGQTWLTSQEGKEEDAQASAATGKAQTASLSSRPRAIQVANADPAVAASYGSALNALPPVEPAPVNDPAHTGSAGTIPPEAPTDGMPAAAAEETQASRSLPLLAAPAVPDAAEATETGSTQASLAPAPEPESDLVDLNTGSFEELNTIEGGGPIGRAIIKGRPYASAEDLVTKKVLRRSVYEKIKDKVAVR